MGIGHGIGGLNDSRQRGHIGRLLVHLVIHVADQVLVGIDDRRHAHGAIRLDAPGRSIDARETVCVHLSAHSYVYDTACRPQAVRFPRYAQGGVGRALRLTGRRMPRHVDGSPHNVACSRVPSIVTAKRANSMLRTAIS